jgi:hypothetical protein
MTASDPPLRCLDPVHEQQLHNLVVVVVQIYKLKIQGHINKHLVSKYEK